MWWYVGFIVWTALVFAIGFVSGGHNKDKAEKYAASWKEESDKWEARAKLYWEALSEKSKSKVGK